MNNLKTIIFLGVVTGIIIIVARQLKKQEERKVIMNELDMMLTEILRDCHEAYCDDCDAVLAQGTGQYHDDVAEAAYNHGEFYDHMVRIRSWAD